MNAENQYIGKRTAEQMNLSELEAQIFNDEEDFEEEDISLKKISSQFENAEKKLEPFILKDFSGVKGFFYGILHRIGIYSTERLLKRRIMNLSDLISDLESLLKNCDEEIKASDEAYKKTRTRLSAAKMVFENYNNAMEVLLEEKNRSAKSEEKLEKIDRDIEFVKNKLENIRSVIGKYYLKMREYLDRKATFKSFRSNIRVLYGHLIHLYKNSRDCVLS